MMITTKNDQIFELSAPYANEFQGHWHRALYVCSAGLLRSATAAYVGHQLGQNTRACGSENYALIPLSLNLINWAETIYFVNEYNFLSAKDTFFGMEGVGQMLDRKSVIWDIEDVYNYRDPKLVQIITDLLS